MQHTILIGDVLDALRTLPDCSVQCVVTSPPYWGLRDYGVEGQIGLEPTPEEHVEKMVEVFREVRRVLRDDGVLWLNYGDCYASNGGTRTVTKGSKQARNRGSNGGNNPPRTLIPHALKPKDLVGMPWRIAFALQADGWYLRSDIIWSKPNPMPESVIDRPTKSHEYVFLLSKQAQYFYDANAIRERQTGNAHPRGKGLTPKSAPMGHGIKANDSYHVATSKYVEVPGGRNRRTVWEIPPQPMPEAHFATFPEALVEPCIMGGTSERGCCPECGAPWRRVVIKGEPLMKQKRACGADSQGGYNGTSHKMATAMATPPGTSPQDLHKQDALGKKTYTGFNARWKAKQQDPSDVKRRVLAGLRERISSWEPSCTCDVRDLVPCVVLDPFGGSGTVAKVARDLGRSSVLIELNPEYVQIAKKRLRIGEQLDSGVCEFVMRTVLQGAV
jgi:site-specific DNA-methyltransferase (adenine-specific)